MSEFADRVEAYRPHEQNQEVDDSVFVGVFVPCLSQFAFMEQAERHSQGRSHVAIMFHTLWQHRTMGSSFPPPGRWPPRAIANLAECYKQSKPTRTRPPRAGQTGNQTSTPGGKRQNNSQRRNHLQASRTEEGQPCQYPERKQNKQSSLAEAPVNSRANTCTFPSLVRN